MRWKVKLAQLICRHSNLVELATVLPMQHTGEQQKYKAIGYAVTTYECLNCGRFIDKKHENLATDSK